MAPPSPDRTVADDDVGTFFTSIVPSPCTVKTLRSALRPPQLDRKKAISGAPRAVIVPSFIT